MKFCPECGKKHESEICTCGFNFKEYKSKKENEAKENNYLFSEPGMKEINNPYKNINYKEIDKEFEKAKKNLEKENQIDMARIMGIDKNLSTEEIIKALKDKHFTA